MFSRNKDHCLLTICRTELESFTWKKSAIYQFSFSATARNNLCLFFVWVASFTVGRNNRSTYCIWIVYLSLAKTTLSFDEGHDLKSLKVNLQVLKVVLGYLSCWTPRATVCLDPNSAQKHTRRQRNSMTKRIKFWKLLPTEHKQK